MKTINVTFEDGEYNRLNKAKGSMSWHNFILKLVDQITPTHSRPTHSTPDHTVPNQTTPAQTKSKNR